ncbi:secondary thiamine-phosphate synthase enzyme YjbQ [soil metagenome]
MILIQKEFRLKEHRRGFHLITNDILREIPELSDLNAGMCNVFICHTSASICINENADPTVRIDLEMHFNKLAPEDSSYSHDFEGTDDMPAHIKSILIGPSLNIPVTAGRLNLGMWQGIYLNEHRNDGGRRKIIVTIFGI